jgi:hypothetical protein
MDREHTDVRPEAAPAPYEPPTAEELDAACVTVDTASMVVLSPGD